MEPTPKHPTWATGKLCQLCVGNYGAEGRGNVQLEGGIHRRYLRQPGTTILGLRSTTFWLALVVLTIVVVGAAVGGGAGGSLAVANARK